MLMLYDYIPARSYVVCLASRMTVTSGCIPEGDACQLVHNLCFLTCAVFILGRVLSDVTVVLEMRQSIVMMYSIM